MSTEARREEIQRQLQDLREMRERELATFDAVAAAHPELSAPEITALAQKKAEAEVSQSLSLDGVVISVGERVCVKDDIHLLHRADRGHFAADPLRSVYLGEKGQVMRVMKSFQGKPAVELRFADGATKIFFVECLVVAQRSDGAGAEIHNRAAARHTDPTKGVPSLSSLTVPPPPPSVPKVEARPDWGHLCMPHRRPSAALSAAALPASVPPPPPPTVKEVRSTSTKRAALTPAGTLSFSIPTPTAPATSSATELPVKKVIREAQMKPPAAALAARLVVKAPPSGLSRPSPSLRRDSLPATATAGSVQLSRLSDFSMGSVVEEGLGSPLSCEVQSGVPRCPSSAVDSEDIPDLRPTPSSSFCNSGGSVDAAAESSAGATVGLGDAVGPSTTSLHEAPTTPKQATSDLFDEATALAQRRSSGVGNSGTKLCWLVGLSNSGGSLSEPLRISLQAQCTTMFAVFAAVTRKLRWDRQRLTATRLFTDKGVEIKSASAVRDGMYLVATTGCAYKPEGIALPFADVGDARLAPTGASRATKAPNTRPTSAITGTAVAPAATSSSGATPAEPSPAPVSSSRKATPLPKQSTATAAPKRVAPPPLTVAKVIHIRVYENGLYDDNIYRTVTVRPAYKTLNVLKTVITRELQWRDGKKVRLLFDASGAEVVELCSLLDGDTVVASAGDRFVIPYPNTVIHKEAMKLSERLC
ncbi:conserved hypothetical protein [Leishmania braziliensis MHOM/BR/75/M2904]|uniref:Doublecortin domain-containing protein n=2 Tax=Leishmania braziliensis TaxID=5660 RepID=A4HHQ7_LEIBR|nr:conserved hypothetical protein [Leishmania braziliensis MHOM/BR/75/M2904]KAI5685106.1 hypothetical protein MNV84_05725 [Leishmania braziliensis]CAJ2476748.1 unnamed protein product [Leishmania braziliensis]CAJ2477226.1 unnamed protein product [Leishmania braziliensis]CAM40112.1 conserved hypothetical protein [Leishmania braziliensis MHOM/BR/75/M2904]SYZ67787.1 hypothetical_protein [Leishmania braziliensis MHOM/BR/75/M2904]